MNQPQSSIGLTGAFEPPVLHPSGRQTVYGQSFSTPLSVLTLSGDEDALTGVSWNGSRTVIEPSCRLLEAAATQLSEYFAGRRTDFSIPLRPAGTLYRRRVWAAIAAIPYGETISYGALARQTGGGARAVGTACATNPLPLFIPCHRVIGAGGGLGGYSGGQGLPTKQFLLDFEFRNRN